MRSTALRITRTKLQSLGQGLKYLARSVLKIFGNFDSHIRNDFQQHSRPSDADVKDVAEVLANMVFIGKEKRNLCVYYNVISGLCNYVKLGVEMPTMFTVKEGDVYRVMVSAHPEVCAVCPFWSKKSM
jgi:hypothetical protein